MAPANPTRAAPEAKRYVLVLTQCDSCSFQAHTLRKEETPQCRSLYLHVIFLSRLVSERLGKPCPVLRSTCLPQTGPALPSTKRRLHAAPCKPCHPSSSLTLHATLGALVWQKQQLHKITNLMDAPTHCTHASGRKGTCNAHTQRILHVTETAWPTGVVVHGNIDVG